MHVCTQVSIHTYTHTYLFLFCQPRGTRNNDTPVVMSTLNPHFLVSNTILQYSGPKLLGEFAYSKTRAEILQDDPGASWSTRRYNSENTHTHTHNEESTEKASDGQSWKKLSKKIK